MLNPNKVTETLNLDTLNLNYSLAHRILSKTPVPAIYREK
jgi:hypothetical protein